MRKSVDTLVLLAILAIGAHMWLVAGWLAPIVVASGSMAPRLLGPHRNEQCPDCGLRFACDAFDLPPNGRALCPNCWRRFDAGTPRDDRPGDRLYVERVAWLFSTPRRWETIVLRDPRAARVWAVKRVVGLPGETIDVRDGDVFVDGQRARKTLKTLRSLAILVHDDSHRPDAASLEARNSQPTPGWRPAGDGATWRRAGATAAWRPTKRGWQWRAAPSKTLLPLGEGGELREPDEGAPRVDAPSAVGNSSAADDPSAVGNPSVVGDPSAFDPPSSGLRPPSPGGRRVDASVDGVRSGDAPGESYAWLVYHHDQSPAAHGGVPSPGPITDDYAYNQAESRKLNPAFDLLLSLRVKLSGGARLALRVDDGRNAFEVMISGERNGVCELRGESGRLASAALDPKPLARGAIVELAQVDGQILLAIEGRDVMAYPYSPSATDRQPGRCPVRIGLAGHGAAEIEALRLLRDIVYLPAPAGAEARKPPWKLGADEYFLLGDNSPVSVDSRSWPPGAARSSLVVGRAAPFQAF